MENHHAFFMGKLTISMTIFNSYVKFPEGMFLYFPMVYQMVYLLKMVIFYSSPEFSEDRLAHITPAFRQQLSEETDLLLECGELLADLAHGGCRVCALNFFGAGENWFLKIWVNHNISLT